jgi:hypothetical protein
VKLKHVGAFTVYFNVHFNISKQIGCALVGLIKDWITACLLHVVFICEPKEFPAPTVH